MSGKVRAMLFAAVLLAASLAGWAVVVERRASVDGWLEVAGTVEATEADLGFQAAGRVERVAVREGDRVAAGEELAWLERAELTARRTAAAAQVAAAEAQLGELEAGSRREEVAQARSALRAAERRVADAELDARRARELAGVGALSRELLERAELQVEVWASQRDQAADQLRLLEAGVRPERIAAQQALVRQAEAQLEQAEAALALAVVRAPFAGIVTIRHREPGESVLPGAPVVTLLDPEDRWVRVYVRADRVGQLRLGQRVEIRSDAYPERRYAGVVSFLSSRAEFTPRTVQTREERVKLVHAVKVRVVEDAEHDLKAGLPADVRLEVGAP
jgi:HlyD family secretion protein